MPGDELTADPAQRYSCVFEGNAQTLDHAVVNAALVNDPAIADLTLAWSTRSMTSKGAFATLTLRNTGASSISGAQVRIELDIPADATSAVGPPSGWTCDRPNDAFIGDSVFVCTAGKPVLAGSSQSFSVSVKPRRSFAASDVLRVKARATVLTDPNSGDNSAVLVLP